VTNTLPPELPLLVGININSTVAKLREMHIFTTDPFRLQETGKISYACFDKTGTLTTDSINMELF